MSTKEQIIVTGATGFIGSAFIEHLVKKNVDVLAIGRKPIAELPAHIKTKINGAKYLNLDMKNINSLDEMISKLGWNVHSNCIFFNLAWGGTATLSDLNVEAQMKNVAWSVDAISSAARIGCKTFIQIGTMEEAFTYKYLSLDHKFNNEYNRHVVYSIAKIAAKNSLTIKAKLLKMNFIYVLHSHIMGPYDNKDSFLQVTLQKIINRDELIFSSGEQYFDVISVKDCALGYYLICKNGIPGSEYWVGSGAPKRLREYIERMYQLYPSGKELQFGKHPYNDIVLEEQDFSISKLTEHTGYAPTMTYEQTVQDLHKFLISCKLGS